MGRDARGSKSEEQRGGGDNRRENNRDKLCMNLFCEPGTRQDKGDLEGGKVTKMFFVSRCNGFIGRREKHCAVSHALVWRMCLQLNKQFLGEVEGEGKLIERNKSTGGWKLFVGWMKYQTHGWIVF
jgi:hypothetical protein